MSTECQRTAPSPATLGSPAGHLRHLIALVLVASLAVLAACGSDSDAEGDAETETDAAVDTGGPVTTSTTPESETAVASTGALAEPSSTESVLPDTAASFPVTITHAFGTSTIESEPERVVVVGLHEADFLYSLGISPIGVHEWWGGYPYATGPWADDLRQELGAEPEVLEGFDVNVEWVAALHPDLIVVTYHDITQTIYEQLSEIAPVVAQHADYPISSTPWREELRQIAEATGRSEQAEIVISGVDAEIAEIVAAHPQLAGANFSTGGIWDETGVIAYNSEDVLNRTLIELGMQVPAELEEMADGVAITITLENLDLLDTLDTFIWLDDADVMKPMLEEIPTYTATDLYKEGRSVFPSRDMVLAMSFNTPLSIPYFLGELAPMLDAALDGDPATVVSDGS